MFHHKNIVGTDVLDHLGLVAATIDKLGIVNRVDELIPLTNGAKSTHGQRVSAMILNGLGFMDDRLYSFPKFLENKPVAKLLGDGLVATDFNDAALGRCLDEIHAYGTTKLFSEIVLPIALKHKLLNKSAHFDTTSLTTYGEYNLPHVEYGHAKNKRFDLKQMTLLLATTGASGFPVWMESHSGNALDKKTLEQAASRMQKLCKSLESLPPLLYVGDSAIYANCVKYGKDLLWLTRVPENMNISEELLLQEEVDWIELDNGYKMYPVDKEYGRVLQRWVLIYSEHAYAKEIITLEKNIVKEHTEFTNILWHLGNQKFGCKKDIEIAIKQLIKKPKYHDISYKIKEVAKYKTKGRPKLGDVPEKIEYQICTVLSRNEISITKAKLTKGKFILATNQLDKTLLADEEVLATYKEQSGTEFGFKFIKDDAFEVDSIFLKKSSRINALIMIMTLCLMVYGFAQYFLRQQLKLNKSTITSQSGRETEKYF